MSSMRRRKRPPAARADSNAVSAANAWPRCRNPVGLGAKRVTIMARRIYTEKRAMIMLDGPRIAPERGPASHLVVLCHGYGSDGNDLIGLAPHWRAALSGAAFASPNAPQRVQGAGYQWFPL